MIYYLLLLLPKIIFFFLFFIICTIIFPIISFIIYIYGYTNNPWDLTAYFVQKILNVKLQKINNNNNNIIKKGVIITNHRSFADFFIDPYLFKTCGISRMSACFIVFFAGLLGIFFNRMIIINRGKDNRHTVYNKIKHLDLFYYYPEGTRCNHLVLPKNVNDIQLKIGLLKSIYENKTKIQIVISSNKEDVMNEKKFILGFNKTIKYSVSKEIDPNNYETFDKFIFKIKNEWFNIWQIVYK